MSATTNYGWVRPTVGGSAGAWGGELNTLLGQVDAQVFSNHAAAAKLAGGNTFSGNQVFTGIVQTGNSLRVGGSQAAGNLGAAVVVQGAAAATATGMEFWSAGVQRGYIYLNSSVGEWIAQGGQEMFINTASRINLQGGEVRLNGSTNGVWVGAADPGGGDSLRINGSVLATNNIRSNATVAAGGNATGRVNLTPSGTSNTGYVEFVRPGGTRTGYIGFGADSGGPDTGEISYVAGTHNFSSGAVVIGGSLTAGSTVVAPLFQGSGFNLTNLRWENVVNVPSNVANAISQADGDARYRRLGVNVPWADVTKPTPSSVGAPPSNLWSSGNIYDNWIAQDNTTQSDMIRSMAQTIDLLSARVAQLRTALINAGLAT